MLLEVRRYSTRIDFTILWEWVSGCWLLNLLTLFHYDIKIYTELCILVLIVMMNFCKRQEMANTEEWRCSIWLQALHLQLTLYILAKALNSGVPCDFGNVLFIGLKISKKKSDLHQNFDQTSVLSSKSWIMNVSINKKTFWCLHPPGSNWSNFDKI